ncbi:ATP/GTP-binding protein [soil metagenome]
MRGVMIMLTAVATMLAGFLLLGSAIAVAGTTCQQTDPTTGQCLIWIEVPDKPDDSAGDGPKDTGSGAACYWDGRKQGISKPPPGPVPCTSEYGYWSNNYRCYIRLSRPQPPTGDPQWRGHEPADGAIYDCYQPQTDLMIYLWSQNPPPNSGGGPTPREVAQFAIAQMELRAIDIGITPEPGAGNVGIVGMPVWLWATNPSSHTVGPITASASAGGITVTVTARLQKLTWDMGDGTKVTCTGAGTPYKASYGTKESPNCGHIYSKSSSMKPDGKFAVTATSAWVITWDGAGQTGTIRLNGLQRTIAIAVGEAQVLVR